MRYKPVKGQNAGGVQTPASAAPVAEPVAVAEPAAPVATPPPQVPPQNFSQGRDNTPAQTAEIAPYRASVKPASYGKDKRTYRKARLDGRVGGIQVGGSRSQFG